jgi:Flp pilus assembly protein TadD
MKSSKKKSGSRRRGKKPTKSAAPARSAGTSGSQKMMSWFRDDASEDEVPDLYLIIGVFVVALALRLIYLGELNDAPFFHHPVGDSRIYHERALGIAGGDLVGREAYFHSSPLYSYFLALVYSVVGVKFTVLRVIQFIVGSASCALIYMLARRAAPESQAVPLAAGAAAALYGTLAFFDGDLLMIPLVILFSCGSILLLTRLADAGGGVADASTLPGGWKTAAAALAAGLLLGLAGLGKPNILVFAPFVVVWILTGFGRRFLVGRWKEAVLFVVGCIVAVAPITYRNYVVSNDLVLVSSNAGVNLYIGNNDTADGVFQLPPDSGLDNARLYLSSRSGAEAATGRTGMLPSEVSAYWTSRATDWMKNNPGRAAGLLFRKFRLFWNHYEIPNHHNKQFVTIHYAAFLQVLVVGFKLVAPLAVMGMVLAVMMLSGSAVVRLYLGFVGVYMIALIPFFITARYRLPVVPFLVVFAAVGVWQLVVLLQKKNWIRAGIGAGTAIAASVFISWPMVNYDFGFNHTVVGTVYSDLATEDPDNAADHIENAIIHYKTALELRPLSVDAHYNLGVAYQRVGYLSGAVQSLETAARLKPDHAYAAKALEEARVELAETGDRIDGGAVPKTDFERGLYYSRQNQTDQAILMYHRVLKSDPHHPGAWSQVGAVHFDRGDYRRAIQQFRQGLKYKPDHFVLNNNIAGAYYRSGDTGRARRHWEKCLAVDPGNESVQRQLKLLDES